MTLKRTVQQLFETNSNYLDAQQALNQAYSLKALSDDLYTDPLRFVYELIQNSDDAYDGYKTKAPIVHIAIVDKNYLIVANYGKPFSERDVRGICCVGCGTKKLDHEKTGYKGLGFKAVFGKSDYVLIASKGNFFRFETNSKAFKWNEKWGKDQTSWETLNQQNFVYPWQICPLWTETAQIPEPIREWLFAQPEVVATIIRLKNISETQEAIEMLTKQPYLFMFLRHIKDVRFSISTLVETSLNISVLKDGSIKISYDNNKATSHWLLYSCRLNVPETVLGDIRLPEKLNQDKVVEMTLAAKIDANDKIEPVRGSDSVLFAYLPTKISTYNLPILVNSNFLVNASREHIHVDSLWNQWLFSCIPNETFKWIQELTKNAKWSEKAYDLLPNIIPAKDKLADRYNQSCNDSVKRIPFLLSIDKNSLSINEAVVDLTMFSSENCIGHELIRDFILHRSSPKLRLARNPFVTNNHRLRNLGITQFTWDRCMEMLQSRYFSSKFTCESDIKFIQYLYIQRNSTQIQKRLYEIPFMMDQSGCLRRVQEIYFPSRFSSADWLMLDSTDAYVHQEVMIWLETQLPIKQWLRKLGIIEKTDMTFVEQYLIPNVRTYINQANAIITIKRLFVLFQNGSLTTQHFHELRKLKLLSANGALVPAYHLYFSADYSPHLSLDFLDLDAALFLSPSYLEIIEKIPAHQWKYFFQSLGVHENICLMPIDDDWYSELVQAYICAHTMNLPSYMAFAFKNRMTILHIELTQINYQFSVYFWEHVIRSININQLNEFEMLLGQRRIPISNLPQWCVRTRLCIPTTTGVLLPSTEVFSNSLLTIAGRYLPVFVCHLRNPHSDAWLKFFGFKTELSIDNCLTLLTLVYLHSQNTGLDDDDERRIQLIYTRLIDDLSRMDQTRRNQCRIKQPIYLLSTNETQFMATIELVYSNDNNFVLPNRVAQLRLSRENASNVHIDLLLEMFNVRQVRLKHLSLSDDTNAQLSRSLHSKLRNIQPYLFALAEFRKIKDHCIDYDFEIFEADRLELCYEKNIPICQRSVYLDNNQLFIKRPWNSNETMQTLSEILCKQFKLSPDFEPDLHLMLMAESSAVIDKHLSQWDIAVQTSLFEDLLSTTGTREKFATMIDRDNTKLFSNLKITDNNSSADVLLAGLEAQESEWSGCVYHFSHLENTANILLDRKLKARGQLPFNDFKDSAAENVIKSTRTNAKNYVRFYFRPLTPTQRCNENLGSADLIERYGNKPMCPVPIFFCFNLKALLSIKGLQWKVSLGNMASYHTQFDCTREIIDKFDYQYVYADTRTERGKYSSQQEFLIESELDFNHLAKNDITLVFQDENAFNSLKLMVPTLEYPTRMDSQFFFGYNPRVVIEHCNLNSRKIVIYINKGLGSSDDGKILVQMASNNNTKTITGKLIGVFIRDDTFTILGRERISFVSEIADLKYAVYYKYAKQIWLVYTNHTSPKYCSPEIDHDDV
ncbi:unnamed protein product [Rotaria socialis]|uniref:DarT domain-containing protein n=1 Tax=Rotaria socialis TaxID=392032 RepID=A0A818PVJ6_9BILA|nr:unnamed protein product [Rotaria socialis]CAF3625150.1 unnamed protein product [Rotaria socialis]CAF4302829.1 unnamed protein product [Rotaria socialis]CAF4463059.1 unnamed protein product [Rotaria socialis]